MNASELLAMYERVADAPDAVEKLRLLVLDLAIRGKLVPQFSEDEPAEMLLKRIAAHKAALPAKRKATLVNANAVNVGIPHIIPASWRWSCLEEIGVLSPRNDEAEDFDASFVPMTLVSADYGTANQHIVKPWRDIKSGYTHFAEGDVGLAKITPCFENRKSTVFRNLTGGFGSGTTELHVLRPILVNPTYVLIFLKSPYFIDGGIPRMTGTAGQKRIPAEYFAKAPFPLPPVAEQHRIVAKVDELMVLCDQLEVALKEHETARDRLTAASLVRLSAPDPGTFQADARFALHVLPALTARPDQIKLLRQVILSLAVRGKLVPQIKRAAQANMASRSGASSLGRRLDAPLPAGWSWVRVSDIAETRLGKMLDRAKNRGRPYPYLGNTNVHWFEIRTAGLKSIHMEPAEFDTYRLQPGDVLICEGGHGIGRTAVWRGEIAEVAFQKALHRVRPGPRLRSDFFAMCCFVYFNAGIMQAHFTGVGIPHFTGRALAQLEFPLPPVEEQDRIVVRVAGLMSVCDELEVALNSGDGLRSRLLDALLNAAL